MYLHNKELRRMAAAYRRFYQRANRTIGATIGASLAVDKEGAKPADVIGIIRCVFWRDPHNSWRKQWQT